MIRRLLALLVGRTPLRPTGRDACGCHPDYHDLGVHSPQE